jgi:aldose 1-epimerase
MSHAISDGRIEGFSTVSLHSETDDLTASFAPAVGMVGCSVRHRGGELLGLRKGLKAYAETGSSMGIPILHPWANRLSAPGVRAGGEWHPFDPDSPLVRRDGNGLPIHGLLIAHPGWQIVSRQADAAGARLVARFDFATHPELLAIFPFPHELVQEARLCANALTIRATLRSTGDVAIPVSFGYHPYFTLPGVPRGEYLVHLPVQRRMLLDERGLPTGDTCEAAFRSGPLGERTFDDLYDTLDSPAVFSLSGGGRRISVSFDEGYPVAQVFAPAGQDFICFEPMTAPTDALVRSEVALPVVPPGGEFAAAFTIRVEDTD